MDSSTPVTINSICNRELRSNASASTSFQNQNLAPNTSQQHRHARSKSTTTSSPILGRRISKSSSKQKNPTKSKKITVSPRDIDINRANESNGSMDCDLAEQTGTLALAPDEIIITESDNGIAIHQNQDEGNQSDDSIETVDQERPIKRKTTATKQDIMKYFTKQPDGSYKCNLCPNANKVFNKANEYSDSNIRSHLGKKHRMVELLYPSQKTEHRQKPASIGVEDKRKLDEFAIKAIIQDALPFDHFRKPGMMKFLSIIKPGYQGPHRKTVRKRLVYLYQQRRKLIKEELSNVVSVSLTADIWKSPRRIYFMGLTCHYLNSSLENKSMVLSFRRFVGRHTGAKIRSFINSELKKMNLQHKVQSITTDSGSDVKCGTPGGEEFGLRIVCSAHNLNLVVKKSLWLFDKTKSSNNSSLSNTIIPTQNDNNDDDDDDDEDDETSTINDVEEILEQSLSDNDYNSDSSEENDSTNESILTSTTTDEGLSENSNEEDDESDDQDLVESNSHDKHQRRTHQETIAGLTCNPDLLPPIIFNLLKRVRILISFIRKSSVLSRYVQHQIKLKQVEIRELEGDQVVKSCELKEVILDFYIRWNTTYVMLSRFIAMSSIITDITLSPSVEIGLKKKQYEKLRKLSFTRFDWLCLTALKDVLYPFYRATKILSGSKYPTLSIAHSVIKGLKNFLTMNKDDQPIENLLKKNLLIYFNHYFEQEMTWEQKRATLISAFLDPTTYPYLSDEDIREAERLILFEFDIDQSFDRLQLNSSTITTTSSMAISSSPTAQGCSTSTTRQGSSSLNDFLRMCEMPMPSKSATASVKKHLSFKEEICHYMATARTIPHFSDYWNHHRTLLPQMVQFVQRYNGIPATSVPSESAFSIAGHIQRKSRSALSSTSLRYLMVLRE